MAIGETNARTASDYARAARSLARHFGTTTIYIIGSQAVLATWREAPASMRLSREIDAYPANATEWEKKNPGQEASEEINALFGQGSEFERAHGFYIDGVDERTAVLPPDWRKRAKIMRIKDGKKTIKAISPSLEDTIVAKLARLDDRDRDFISAAHTAKRLDLRRIERLFHSTRPSEQVLNRARRFLDNLNRSSPK